MTQQEIEKFIQTYESLMQEVKVRNVVLDSIITGLVSGSSITGYRRTDIELAYLQIRKMLEIIAFGSLLLNEDVVRKVQNNIEEWWSSKKIIQELEKIHKDFYPVPINRGAPETIQGVKGVMNLEHNTTKPYLTKSEFEELYSMASGWIHTPSQDYH